MSMLTPHGACLLWKPELIWLNAASDALLAIAFFVTAFVLGFLRVAAPPRCHVPWRLLDLRRLRRVLRADPPASILTLWVPAYDIESLVKGFLALVSLGVTAALLLMLPRLLVLPTRVQLAHANAALEEEIEHRRKAEAMVDVFRRSRPTRPRSGRRRRWKPSASSPAAWRTTSTTF